MGWLIAVTVVLFVGIVGFLVFIVIKNRHVSKPEKEETKPVVVKKKPQKVALTPEQKEEKKQKEYSSKITKCSDTGVKRSKEVFFEEDENGIEAVGIIYNEKSRVYMFNPNGNKLNIGDVVIVLDQSNAKRTVPIVMANKKIAESNIVQPFKDILEVVYRSDAQVSNPTEPVEEKVEPEEVQEEAPQVEETPVQEEPQEEPAQEDTPAEEPVVEETKVEEPQEETPVEPQQEPEPQPEEPVEESKEEEKPVEPEPTPVPEEVKEETQPEPQEEPEEDDSDDDSDDEDSEEESEGETETKTDATPQSTTVVFDEATKKYRIIKTKRTYECKISMLSDDVKKYYDTLRNKLLAYGLKNTKTKSCEKFKIKRDTVAILKVAGKQVALYLALDPQDYADSKYKGKDVSEKASYKATPFLYKTKTERKTNWAVELIDKLAEKNYLQKNDGYKDEKYAEAIPSMTEEEMIEKGYLTKTETVVDEAPKGFVKYVEEK